MTPGFRAAQVAATHSNGKRSGSRVGAALFAKSKLLSIGFNLYGKSHPDAAPKGDFVRSLHAEHKAVLKRRHYDNAGNLTVFVWRETADGKPACSKPCGKCSDILKEAGVSTCWFVNTNGQPERMRL